MELSKYLIVVSLIAVLLVAGCAGGPSEEPEQNETEVEDQQPQEKESETETETETEAEGPECTTNEDCDDGDDCTMDSCVDGECKYSPNYDCVSKEHLEPSITEVSFTGEEYVKVEAKNWDVSKWTVEKPNGSVLFTFPKDYTLNNYVSIYSMSDLSTSTKKYADVGEDFWSDDGDKALLVAKNGTTISEMSG